MKNGDVIVNIDVLLENVGVMLKKTKNIDDLTVTAGRLIENDI